MKLNENQWKSMNVLEYADHDGLPRLAQPVTVGRSCQSENVPAQVLRALITHSLGHPTPR